MAVRGRKEKSIDRGESAWHAFIDDLRKLRGTATLSDIGAALGYSAGHLSRTLSPGNTNLTEDFVRAYAKACGADPEEWAQRRSEALRASQPATDQPTVPDPAHLSGQVPSNTPETLVRKSQALWRHPAVALAAAGLVVLGSMEVRGWWSGDRHRSPSAPTTLEPLAQQCRPDWAPVAQASLSVMPCIERGADGVMISVKYKAIPQDGTPGEATVWLWLMYQDPQMIKDRTMHLTRNESTLRRCRVQLDNGDQVQTCGPFRLDPPAKKGTYTTASSARMHDSVYPPGWEVPEFSGTQGGVLPWKSTS
ncbi:helix-turn-helix domain-containing protein [Streptomyces chromofuscus]|uniref:helix-turn-helix domain-containing protein n=1 Tax=Streptomyces chromofuscus TaxID=42881 RepID=UPI00167433E6|nr:helix-turn-helix transcriptional regulator [Streptomyces chromofuscus]GGT45050.1 hypothetical protein GCM10010254_75080 [Streptomyces chromofuscus]